MRIKLITFNIWHGTYLDEVIDFLRAEKADVVCLQEASTSGWRFEADKRNILTEIQEAVDMEGVYAPMFEIETKKGSYDVGVAILSRRRVIDSGIFAYAGGYTIFGEEGWRYKWPGVVLVAEIESLPFKVATTHLPVTHKASVTKRQLAAAAEVSRVVSQYDGLVLGGDMNTLPGSGTYKMISKGLKDIGDHEVPTLHPTIHQAGKKGYHVDYVFYKGTGIKHVSTRIPQVDASDHLPVVVEFEVE